MKLTIGGRNRVQWEIFFLSNMEAVHNSKRLYRENVKITEEKKVKFNQSKCFGSSCTYSALMITLLLIRIAVRISEFIPDEGLISLK